jgi:hypothetical protein
MGWSAGSDEAELLRLAKSSSVHYLTLSECRPLTLVGLLSLPMGMACLWITRAIWFESRMVSHHLIHVQEYLVDYLLDLVLIPGQLLRMLQHLRENDVLVLLTWLFGPQLVRR